VPRLCGQIGQVHAQRFARDAVGRIVGKEVHAGDQPVGLEHEIVPRGRRDGGGVVSEAERAGVFLRAA
jgi:hypothetical protein